MSRRTLDKVPRAVEEAGVKGTEHRKGHIGRNAKPLLRITRCVMGERPGLVRVERPPHGLDSAYLTVGHGGRVTEFARTPEAARRKLMRTLIGRIL